MGDAEQTAPKCKDAEIFVILIALAAACCQWSIGAQYDKTGEQVSTGLPLATLVVVLSVVALIVIRRRLDWPVPRWPHIAFLAAMSLGLWGLTKPELKGAIKEMIQLAEIFGLAWYLFATIPKEEHKRLIPGIAAIGCILILLSWVPLDGPPLYMSKAHHAALLIMATPFMISAWRDKLPALAAVLTLCGVSLAFNLKNGGLLAVWAVVSAASCILILSTRKFELGLGAAVLCIGISFCTGQPSAWDSLNPTYFDKDKKKATEFTKRLFIEYRASMFAPKQFPLGGGWGEYNRTIKRLKLLQDKEPSSKENKIVADTNSQYLVTMVESSIVASIALLIFLGTVAAMPFLYAHRNPADPIPLTIGCSAIGLLLVGFFTTTIGRGVGIWMGAIIGLSTVWWPGITFGWKSALTRLVGPATAIALGLIGVVLVNKKQDKIHCLSKANLSIRSRLGVKNPIEPKPNPKPPIGKVTGHTDSGLKIVTLLDDDDDDDDSGSGLRIEGEAFLKATGKIIKVKANDASGNEVLSIPDNTGKGVGEASYEIEIPTKGKYILNARVRWADGCGNSVAFELADKRIKLESGIYKQWHELRGQTALDLPKGVLSITLQNVEDGIQIDYFELIPADG